VGSKMLASSDFKEGEIFGHQHRSAAIFFPYLRGEIALGNGIFNRITSI
jgi:hypothetical protein